MMRRWTLRRAGSKKRLLAVTLSGLLCLLAVGRCGWLIIGPGSWGPRFACAEPYFDCGGVPTGKAVEHEYTLENTGRKPLHILQAVPGCGACLTVNVSKTEIAPGGTAVLRVVLDSATLEKGNFTKAVLVKTDDPNLPTVILYIHGTAL
jgi:hypothetical protein